MTSAAVIFYCAEPLDIKEMTEMCIDAKQTATCTDEKQTNHVY